MNDVRVVVVTIMKKRSRRTEHKHTHDTLTLFVGAHVYRGCFIKICTYDDESTLVMNFVHYYKTFHYRNTQQQQLDTTLDNVMPL